MRQLVRSDGFLATVLLDAATRVCRGDAKEVRLEALGRAERRAWEMLQDGNPGGYEIWITVAATIRQIQATVEAAE